MLDSVKKGLHSLWSAVRSACGDDAYERYVDHWRSCHPGEGPLLDRKSFFREELERRWSGVRRCC